MTPPARPAMVPLSRSAARCCDVRGRGRGGLPPSLDHRTKLALLRSERRVAREPGGSERLASIMMVGAAAN
ncbi:hypothetical protein FHY05_002879 [Sphingomonas sp. BK580]|nr:hypothetical protein [Sphingomonas sp. BK580]